jgi:plastocyanin
MAYRVPRCRRRAPAIGFAVLAVLVPQLVAGCAANGAAAARGRIVEVGGLDSLRFDPDTIRVRAGEAVTIRFRNRGALAHDYVTYGGQQNAALTDVAGGGAAEGTFVATKPGAYPVVCVQRGHKEAGMVGTIVVE